jgi:hypothetical protein
MAPDLTWEGSSVQRPWLVEFLKNPNTQRPSLIRRMPRFNLTDGEANELTDYIMTVYQSPSIDRDSMPLSGYPQGQVELGSFSMASTPARAATSWIPRPIRAISARLLHKLVRASMLPGSSLG